MDTYSEFLALVDQHRPGAAIVLGSGLGSVPHRFEELGSIPFSRVPGLVAPSVHGHSGTITLGLCAGQPLLVFRGRLHFYEGHSWDQVAAPISLALRAGIRRLILTNAAGGIHADLEPGDLMLIRAHLFWQVRDGWKEPARAWPYTEDLIARVRENESRRGRQILVGVYGAMTGPCYETPAEIRALCSAGADAVGMSTAHEAQIASQLGMECLAISSITNKAAGLAPGVLDHQEVLAAAHLPAQRISEIVEDLLRH